MRSLKPLKLLQTQLRRVSVYKQVGAAGNVIALLEKAGSVSVRPDEIEGEDPSRPFGLDGQIYRLSPAQVGAILEFVCTV